MGSTSYLKECSEDKESTYVKSIPIILFRYNLLFSGGSTATDGGIVGLNAPANLNSLYLQPPVDIKEKSRKTWLK